MADGCAAGQGPALAFMVGFSDGRTPLLVRKRRVGFLGGSVVHERVGAGEAWVGRVDCT